MEWWEDIGECLSSGKDRLSGNRYQINACSDGGGETWFGSNTVDRITNRPSFTVDSEVFKWKIIQFGNQEFFLFTR